MSEWRGQRKKCDDGGGREAGRTKGWVGRSKCLEVNMLFSFDEDEQLPYASAAKTASIAKGWASRTLVLSRSRKQFEELLEEVEGHDAVVRWKTKSACLPIICSRRGMQEELRKQKRDSLLTIITAQISEQDERLNSQQQDTHLVKSVQDKKTSDDESQNREQIVLQSGCDAELLSERDLSEVEAINELHAQTIEEDLDSDSDGVPDSRPDDHVVEATQREDSSLHLNTRGTCPHCETNLASTAALESADSLPLKVNDSKGINASSGEDIATLKTHIEEELNLTKSLIRQRLAFLAKSPAL